MKQRLTLLAGIMLVMGSLQHLQAYNGYMLVAPSGQTIYYDFDSTTSSCCIIPPIASGWGTTYTKPTGDLVIPDSINHDGVEYPVTAIGNKAFYECRDLTSIVIPGTITTIGTQAFYDCSGLFSVVLPASIDSIGENGFRWVKNIVYNGADTTAPWGALTLNGYIEGNFVYEDNTKTILSGCNHSVVDTVIPNTVTTIDYCAFDGCAGLQSVTIPNTVTTIGNAAFFECSGLTNITIPTTVTSISKSLFYNCSSLTSAPIHDSITVIGDDAFYGCTSLTSVTIPNSVLNIGEYAFSKCSTLVSVSIGESVLNIGKYAFYYCYNLDTVYLFPFTPPTINGSNTFMSSYCPDIFYVPNGTLDVYRNAWGYSYNFVEMNTTVICMVSVQNNRNVVIWNKDDVVSGYKIYREGATLGDYQPIATVPYNAMSMWADTSSRPMNRSYRYRISAIDINGEESSLSMPHKTMHLTINKGMGNSWNLSWNEYEGTDFTTYMIYRGTSAGNLQLLEVMAVGGNNSYTDSEAPDGPVYYQICVLKREPCNPTKSEEKIFSNIATSEDDLGVGSVAVDGIAVYSIGSDIVVSGADGRTVAVYDMMGREVGGKVKNEKGETSIAVPISGVYGEGGWPACPPRGGDAVRPLP